MCVFVLPLVTRHENRYFVFAPQCIIIYGLSGSTIFFPYYLIKGTIFVKKRLLTVKCVFLFSPQLLSETFLILIRIKRDIINVHRSSCKAPVVLARF